MRTKQIIMMSVSLFWMACSGSGSKTSYEGLTQEAGASLTAGSYQSALTTFREAQNMNPDRWEAYSGVGWCNLKLDNLAAAASSFSSRPTDSPPPSGG